MSPGEFRSLDKEWLLLPTLTAVSIGDSIIASEANERLKMAWSGCLPDEWFKGQ